MPITTTITPRIITSSEMHQVLKYQRYDNEFAFPLAIILHIFSFCQPKEIYSLMTSPFSKHILAEQASEELWDSLCTTYPWQIPRKQFNEMLTSHKIPFSLKVKPYSSKEIFKELLKFTFEMETFDIDVSGVVDVLLFFLNAMGVIRQNISNLRKILEQEDLRIEARKVSMGTLLLQLLERYTPHKDIQLHCLHSLVLLARPTGGSEGMIFHRQNTRLAHLRLFEEGMDWTSAVLTSMRIHRKCAELIATGCWALVNLALHPAQKQQLLHGGALTAVAEAMRVHPCNSQVQFRAQFALINLVAPDRDPEPLPEEVEQPRRRMFQLQGAAQPPSKNSENLKELTTLVLKAMDTFKREKEVVSRGCLVLHNLSLDLGVHRMLLTVGVAARLAEVLVWYAGDPFLCQSAANTLRRLGAPGYGSQQEDEVLPEEPRL